MLWLEAGDVVMCNALTVGDFTATEAMLHAIVCVGRARRHLELAEVAP